MARNLISVLVAVLVVASVGDIAWAQFAGDDDEIAAPETNFEVANSIQPLGEAAFGEKIDMQEGSLSLFHTDVSLPGNSKLKVEFARRYSIDGTDYFERSLGGWNFEIPFITAYVDQQTQWQTNPCTGTMRPPTNTNYTSWDRDRSWGGLILFMPGGGGELLIESVNNGAGVFGSSVPKKTTVSHYRVECLTSVSNASREGFIVTTTDGTRYTFGQYAQVIAGYYSESSPCKSESGVSSLSFSPSIEICTGDSNVLIPVYRHNFYVTRVEDVSGNYVNYSYNADNRLTRIEGSDGRLIVISYSANKSVSTVTANGRVWTYSYINTVANAQVLQRVTLPDGRFWSFDLPLTSISGRSRPCSVLTTVEPTPRSIKHPDGATAAFDFALIQNGKTNVPAQFDVYHTVLAQPPACSATVVDRASASFAVVKKTVMVDSGQSHVWTYTYEQDGGYLVGESTPAQDLKKRTIVDPLGHKSHFYYNRRHADPVQDLLIRAERESADGGILETTVYTYTSAPSLGDNTVRFPGNTPRAFDRPLQTRTVYRGADTFTTANSYNLNLSSSGYSFNFPVSIAETSSTAPGVSRSTAIVYTHNKTKWVIGLPSTITRNGKLFDSFTYDTLGRRLTQSRFGVLQRTYAYNVDGTLSTSTDPHGHVTTYSSWKRGQPQAILQANGVTVSRVVDNNGFVTSFTDGRGIATNFSYNNVGWATLIDNPAPFADETIVYSGLGSGVIETRTRGAKKTTTTYDGMLRPTQVKTEATDGSAATSYVETAYDAFGKPTFQSWPSGAAGSSAGMATTYDALGRVLTVAETVAPYATTTTQYLSGGEVRVTDPANAVVRAFSRAFGDPDEVEPMSVIDAMGATTTMTRDIYGNVLTLAQSGTQNGFTASVTRNFWYDNELRLCRHRAPEFGDEVFLYDSGGQLIQQARGVAAAAGCVTSIATNERLTHGYDAVHRETSLTFPTGQTTTFGIFRTYDGNGNLTSVSRGNGGVWNYAYTALDAILTEQLAIDGRTYTIGHSYNANGDVTARSNSHSGVTVDFNSNAYGQLRRASIGSAAYIFNGLYHPNGMMKSADIGGGYPGAAQALSQTINNRNLISELKVAKAGGATAVWLTPQYDERRKLASIADLDGAGDDESRDFTYDANGRLLTANGPWGSGSYVYDALGNIRNRTEGSNSVSTMNYDAANRVSSATISGQNRTFAYDSRGNTTNNGKYSFVYDFANQPVSQTGTVNASFAYDGNLKRVKEVRGGKTIYTVYSRVTGGLVYRDEATDGIVTDYVSVGAAAVRLKKTGAGPIVPEYTHFDLQGSAVAATDAAGAVTWRESYRPYGRTRLDPPANDNNTGYTGHLEDSSTGLVYMQARYYDPLIGRFYSTDPIGYQDQLNLYAYVHNDPVNKVDPTGEFIDTVIDIAFLVSDVADIAQNGFTAENTASLLGDAAGLAIPGATGLGKAAAGAVFAVKAADKAKDGAKLSQRAATREAKRQAGIPTSQQAKSQTSATAKDGTKVGRQQTHETPKPGGGTQEKSVQVSRDQVGSHAGQPQIEAGNVKAGGQTDSAGRPRIENENKVRVDFDPDR